VKTAVPNPAAPVPASALPAKQITDLLIEMIKETGNWFSFGQVVTSARYKNRLRGANFAVALAFAVALDLQPIPTGDGSLAGKIHMPWRPFNG
jgi:hypothetical protein